MSEPGNKNDLGLGCWGSFLFSIACLGGAALMIYAVVRFVKWAWAD